MWIQKLRDLGCFTAACLAAYKSYSILFDGFDYLGFVVLDWQCILNVDLCLLGLGYHYNYKHS